MGKDKQLKVRVDEDESSGIKNNAKGGGYKSVAAFILDVAYYSYVVPPTKKEDHEEESPVKKSRLEF